MSNATKPSPAWQWLVEGWHALREKASQALTQFSGAPDTPANTQQWGVLASDVSEHKDLVHVELELPGVDKSDLQVEVRDGQLIVIGQRESSATRNEGSLVVTERAYGRFKRVIGLPVDVDASGTRARYRRGVLTVDLPKRAQRRGRQIDIAQG